MIIDRFIKKSNVLTDGNLPDRVVLTEKLLNVVYANYSEKGTNFKITFADLYKQLNIKNHSENKQRLKDSIKILTQSMELKNYTQADGRRVKWFSGSFMKAFVYEDTRDWIDFEIDSRTIYAIEQLNQYTVIDINISNQFKTKYGITIWQMYLRYKNATRDKISPDVTYQMFSIDDLNKKFGSNYNTKSELKRCIDRGLKEIKKITDKDISVKWQNDFDKFGFFWKREIPKPKFKTDKHEFINHIRKNYVNDFLLNINLDGVKVDIACSSKGLLYDMTKTISNIEAKRSKKLWEYLFENQNKITVLGQTRMSF